MQARTHLSTAFAIMLLGSGITACGHVDGEPLTPAPRPTANFPNIGYADWTEQEPSYRFYPGDEIEARRRRTCQMQAARFAFQHRRCERGLGRAVFHDQDFHSIVF